MKMFALIVGQNYRMVEIVLIVLYVDLVNVENVRG